MKERIRNNNILLCLCAPMIIGLILMIVYFIHGVYPFGDNTVSYYDMSQSFVPLYYHTWDVLHGIKDVYFDWNIGMGCSLADVESAFLFFPSNLFFLFVKRESILYVMSVFLLIKMMIAAFSMSYYVINKYDNKALCVYAGIAYASCGYILQYYTNIYYLDTVMIFPILILALDKLIQENEKIPYIVLLFLTFLTNMQMVFMVVIYIIIKGWLIIRHQGNNTRGRSIISLILCSLAGALLSAFAFVPCVLLTMQSVRYGNATSWGYIDIITTIGCEFPEQKDFMFYAGEIGIGGAIYVLLKGREKIKKHADLLIMIALLSLPVALDSIDLLWSGGSYMHFPMRFGYMLSFELILLTVELCSGKEDRVPQEGKKSGEYLILGGIILIPVSGVFLGILCSKFRVHGIRDLTAYKGYGILLTVIVTFSILILFSGYRKITQYLILFIAIIQASCGMYGLIAPEGEFSLECGDGFVISADKVYNNIEHKDSTNRIKDRDILLNSNYGFIVNQSSMGCWMNGASPNVQSQMRRMGYTANYTRILDGCGTAFTDALLGVRKIYGKAGMNSNLYTNMISVGDEYIYDCAYQMPFGIIMGEVSDTDGFDYQNSLYCASTGMDNRLIDEVDISDASKTIFDAENGVYVFDKQIHVEDKAVLYVYAKSIYDIENKYSFAINDMQVPLDAQGSEGNIMYTQFFLNGILELGTYENETVDLKVLTIFDNLNDVHVGLMRLDTLAKGIDVINRNNQSVASVSDGKLLMDYNSEKGGTLFLPIAYYDDYAVTMDGEKAAYFPILGDAFVGMEVSPGEHAIEIEYKPEGQNVGGVLSFLGIGLTVLTIMFTDKLMLGEKANRIWMGLYNLVICGMAIILYCLPVVGALVKIFGVIGKYYF